MDVDSRLKEFITKLSSLSDEARRRSAIDLRKFVESNLKSLTLQNYAVHFDHLCNELKLLLNDSTESRTGAIYAIASLVDVDFVSIHTHCYEYIRTLQLSRLSSEPALIALEARLMGNFGLYLTSDYVEEQLKLCHDNFQVEKATEAQILYSATVRECAALSFRASFAVIAERDFVASKKSDKADFKMSSDGSSVDIHWYLSCIREALTALVDNHEIRNAYLRRLNKEEIYHGSLLLLYELLNCTSQDHVELLDYLDKLAFQSLEEHFCFETAGKSYFPSKEIRKIYWPTSASSSFFNNLVGDAFLATFKGPRQVGLAASEKVTPTALNLKVEESPDLLWYSRIRVHFSNKCKAILIEKLDRIWNDVLLKIMSTNLKNNRITQLLMRLVPLVISIVPNSYPEQVKKAIDWLFACLSKGKEVPLAVFTLALVAFHMGDTFVERGYLKTFYETLTGLIEKPVATKQKSNSPQDTAILMAIILLGIKFDQTYSNILVSLLESIMTTSGLSRPLISTCQVLALQMSNLNKRIQDSLLKILRNVVIGCATGVSSDAASVLRNKISLLLAPRLGNQNTVPFFLSSSVTHKSPTNNAALNDQTGILNCLTTGSVELADFREGMTLVSLAINTIGSFDFDGYHMAPLMRYISDHLINIEECELKELRMEAVRALACLMKPWIKCCEMTKFNQPIIVRSIEGILTKLLAVGTSDPGLTISLN
ncbi:hypothetical protein Ciccas_005260 [Cichlidogyrus casuarinus]|uniref:Uncharacterized protein n=1 Tax=Cichlidogyrus casuarinus TaxID=1844966 RepID=A0ABD2Q955_9PLAT